MSRATEVPPARPQRRSARRAAALAGIVAAAGLVAGPAVAQAASRAPGMSHSRASAVRPAPASVCSKVSPAAVQGVVGWSVPAPVTNTYHNAANASDDEIASTETSCVYGHPTSLATISQVVTLITSTASKSLSAAQIQALVNKALATAAQHHVVATFKPYPGLGVPAWYLDFSVQAFSIRGIVAGSGNHSFGAIVDSSTLPTAKIASLAKLAEQL
jgi:hypothetical protein